MNDDHGQRRHILADAVTPLRSLKTQGWVPQVLQDVDNHPGGTATEVDRRCTSSCQAVRGTVRVPASEGSGRLPYCRRRMPRFGDPKRGMVALIMLIILCPDHVQIPHWASTKGKWCTAAAGEPSRTTTLDRRGTNRRGNPARSGIARSTSAQRCVPSTSGSPRPGEHVPCRMQRN